MTVTDIKLQNSIGVVIALGAREDDYVLESVDWGTARVSVSTIYYFPTDDSERMLNRQWEPRPVSIIGWVIGADEAEIESKSQALEDFVIVQSETDIIYNYYHLTFFPTAEIKWANTEVDNNEFWRKFHITGVCIDPMWKNKSTFEINDTDNTVVPMFRFPLWFNQEDSRVEWYDQDNRRVVFGHRYGENSLVVDYEGASSEVIITLQSVGIIDDFTMYRQNGATIQAFRLTGTYPANTKIVIDTREGFRTVTADEVDVTDKVMPGSNWFRIVTGINIFEWFHNGSEPLQIDVSINQDDLFEVQT